MTRKPYYGIAMEGPIATWYTKSTAGRVPQFRKAAADVAAAIASGSAILEVAPGPGYLSIELAKLGTFRVTGVDISKSFVRIASKKAADAGVQVEFREGDVARMPFADGSFDFVICQAAFKNFPEPLQALNEIHRVLRPGGRASIQDMNNDASREDIDEEIRGMRLGPVNALLMPWIFRFGLLRQAYPVAAIRGLAACSLFGGGEIYTQGIGFDLRLRKSAPT